MNDIEKSYAKTFHGTDGARVLTHLRGITIERFLGPDASDAALRALEGQRALVHQIEQLIDRGKNS
ncbi:MAG: hypothetical protein LBJ18_00120 [Rickettsiales bacterium]|jgi:hypothetical protein|nr:hypothetical protein [Rickettsiales bacterium]